jgi:hypothetical protein
MPERHVVHLVLDNAQREQLRRAVAYWADLLRLRREETGVPYPESEIAAEQVADMVWLLTEEVVHA